MECSRTLVKSIKLDFSNPWLNHSHLVMSTAVEKDHGN